jgi:hypothetical protein
MSLTALVIGGVLTLAIICVSLYGVATLPPGALVPVHFGPGGYNRWLPKNVGLALWPALSVVVYVVLLLTGHSQQSHGRPGPTVGLSIALGVILVTQIGALTLARRRGNNG